MKTTKFNATDYIATAQTSLVYDDAHYVKLIVILTDMQVEEALHIQVPPT